jgi:hypothetical protein
MGGNSLGNSPDFASNPLAEIISDGLDWRCKSILKQLPPYFYYSNSLSFRFNFLLCIASKGALETAGFASLRRAFMVVSGYHKVKKESCPLTQDSVLGDGTLSCGGIRCGTPTPRQILKRFRQFLFKPSGLLISLGAENPLFDSGFQPGSPRGFTASKMTEKGARGALLKGGVKMAKINKVALLAVFALGLFAASAYAGEEMAAGFNRPYGLTEVVGSEVKNLQGGYLGRITDLVIDPHGRVAFAVLAHGGFLRMGETSVAIPFEALTFDQKETTCPRHQQGSD